MKFWLVLIEGALLAIAVFAGIWAFQIWQNSSAIKPGGCQETISVGKSFNGIDLTACRLIGSSID
jgi:hypothetical protein